MDSSEEDVLDELTVAMYLDSIEYDAKNKEYEIELSAVQLLHFDAQNDVIRLKVPSHRLQRIRTPTFNAENFESDGIARARSARNKRKIRVEPESDISDDNGAVDDHPNVDEITGIILANSDEAEEEEEDHDHEEKRSYEIRITPNKMNNIEVKPIRKGLVQREWNDISKKYKTSDEDDWAMTKDGCFKRIIFILKYYTRWILYQDKHFRAHDMPQNDDFVSISSLFNALEGYDKIKLLDDYYYLLKNVLLDAKSATQHADDLEQLILNNDNILHCEYCLNRVNRRNAELYNTDKLSVSLRRDLYFIHDSNHQIEEGSVEERVEIGIQQYLDVLYCSLFFPSNCYATSKYIDDATSNGDSDYLFGEYFTYWKPDHTQYCRAKYNDLKAELLSNTIYAIHQRDFFCLYNRAKDFLLSIMGKSHVAKRVKVATKIKIDQRLSINHVIALLIYCNYYDDFVGAMFIKRGCMKLNAEEGFGDIRLRNNEIANWCRLLNEAIFCFGDMLSGDERLYYSINRKVSFQCMSLEYNVPMSSTSKYSVMDQYKKNEDGIILRLGKFEASKEYNYAFHMAFLSNYPLESERLIYGGKFEINDIIYDAKTHYSDIQSLKLYLQIMKGRWFSHNKLLFKKQYEKKLIAFIVNYLKDDDDDEKEESMVSYMQLLFNNIASSNGTTKKNKSIYINKECDKLLPSLKKLLVHKLVPHLTRSSDAQQVSFRKGYNTVLTMKTNFNTINNSNFNKSLYSSEYKYQLLYCHNNRPQEIVFHFRCYKKYDDTKRQSLFKGCFEIKQLPPCVSKCKIIGGLLLPQIQFEKWDFITLSPKKLYSGSSLFDIQKIKNFDSVLIKIAFQIKEVIDIDGYQIPTID